jgi:TFIIF-interacting CTD phosphatase-like protein
MESRTPLRIKVACITSNRGERDVDVPVSLSPEVQSSPGWEHFLKVTATKYQMHIYTMGTRAYAEEVCAAIDPDGKLFGGRILSRDESGSESINFSHLDIY